MAIISLSDMQGFLDDHPTEDDLDLQGVVDAVNAWIENYCKRTFDSTAHTEYHSGKGSAVLHLDHYPVTEVTRLAINRIAAVYVTNTNAATTSSVTVNATGVVLTYNGTASSLLFADYATLTLLVAAINALSSSGWSAELAATEYGSYLSTELCAAYGRSCINSRDVDLEIPDEAEWDYQLDPDSGIITLASAFPAGTRNVRVDYTAGYAEADMPEDLRLAAKIVCKDWYEKRSESAYGLGTYSVGGMSKQILADIPREARRILDAYRRYAF